MTVSMASVKSAGGAAGYFSKDNYYTNEESVSLSGWSGTGAREAGLGGHVDKGTFEAVLNGELPGGRQIGQPGTRAFGTDLTFSMPKSASLLALVSGDKRLLAANLEAVKDTMRWVEKNLAETRIRSQGKVIPVRTGNLVYALFQHDTSRALDPQAHVHAIIANMTRLPAQYRNPDRIDANGRTVSDHGWRAWHNGAVWQANTVIGSIYHAHLRERIGELGYRTDVIGKHGTFEIAGIVRTVLEGFSKRRQDIVAKAAELGIVSREGLLGVTLRTRDPKLNAGSRSDLLARWQAEGSALGFNGDAVHREALARSRDPRTGIERGTRLVVETLRTAGARIADYLARPGDPLVDKRIASLGGAPASVNAQYAAASAINILAERETSFSRSAVIKTALDLALPGVTPAGVEKRLAELIKAGRVVPEMSVRHDGAVDTFTTRRAIEQERRIVAAMHAGAGQARPLMRADLAAARLQELAGDRPLNPEQLEAAVRIVSSPDRIVLIQGRAGSGKSTLLQSVARAEALDAAGKLLAAEGKEAMLLTAEARGNATGLAFQNKMVADLKADTGMEAMTVHRFLHGHEKLLGAGGDTPASAKARAALKGRYLILDEGSMISNAQMDKLTAIANAMEVGRLAIIGDRKQINPIDAGKSFTLMQAAHLAAGKPVSRVDYNMRQQPGAMRTIADLADAGRIRAAIEMMGTRVIETPDRIAAASAAWLALPQDQRSATTLLTSGREGRARANQLIQEGLKAEGTLQGTARQMQVRERVNLTHEELRYAHTWRDAAVLEVGDSRNGLGLPRGDYRIDRIYKNGKIGIVDRQGRTHRVNPLRIEPGKGGSALRLANDKTIAVHAGEVLRWTDNDMKRGIANATIVRVEALSAAGVTVRLANGERRLLANSDPMLRRIDLAYAINTHMAQGITNTAVFTVMGSRETNLSNARNFLVNHTRQREDLRLFTDDKEKLIRQIERNPGDKSSALETIGELRSEAILARDGKDRHQSAGQSDPFGMPHDMPHELRHHDPFAAAPGICGNADPKGSSPGADKGSGKGVAMPGDHAEPDRKSGKAPVREQPQLDRSKGMEL